MKRIKNLKTLLMTVGIIGSFSLFNCFAMEQKNYELIDYKKNFFEKKNTETSPIKKPKTNLDENVTQQINYMADDFKNIQIEDTQKENENIKKSEIEYEFIPENTNLSNVKLEKNIIYDFVKTNFDKFENGNLRKLFCEEFENNLFSQNDSIFDDVGQIKSDSNSEKEKEEHVFLNKKMKRDK